MATKIQVRRDTAANWTSADPILSQGEPGLETDTNQVKYGDGSTAWSSLDYQSGGSGGGGAYSRTTKSGTSASLADDANGNIDITGFKGYNLYKVTTDRAAWVRIYTNAASRTADNARTIGTDPAYDAGVIAEVITTGAETVIMSPGVIGFNDEGTVGTNIAVNVTNLSGSTSTVAVTLTLLQTEA